MRFVDTPEQEELARGARAFAERRYPVAHLRQVRERAPEARIDRDRWREAAQVGWAGLLVDDAHGGAGLGMIEAGLILEQLGRTLAPTPMISTALVGATLLAGRPEAAAIARGEVIVALAIDERPRFAPHAIEARLREGVLDATKENVVDGPDADLFLVVAQGGIALVDRAAPGVTVTSLSRVDSRSAADVRFEGVRVRATIETAALDLALARATAGLAAEMLGGADAVFATTIDYLKTRRQFGVPIGSFQALKHRAAHLFCELELTRAVVRAALAALDSGAADKDTLVSAAKARASDTFALVAAEAVQMHGGIGVTDELDIGFYYKRARVAELTFGSAAYHRERFAKINGY